MKNTNTKSYRFITAVAAVLVVGSLVVPCLAAEPAWRDVPSLLQKEDGVQRQGEFLYATGMARAATSVRPDKTYEVARKKSLLRALQLVHMAVSCQGLVADLDLEERQEFIALFACLAPATRVQGLTVIRQWEKNRAHFTAVAAPLVTLENMPCEFPDLTAAISRYAKVEQVSPAGLAFGLRHAPRYSRLNHMIKKRTGLWFQKQGRKDWALCFLDYEAAPRGNSATEILAFQNGYDRAVRYISWGKKLAEKGEWEDAAAYASQALDLVQTYGPAYLLLSDYFRYNLNIPSFALSAAEKALRDGTLFEEALSRIVTCLEEMKSPETEVFQYLLSQVEHIKEEWSGTTWSAAMPASWKQEMERLADNPVQNLVVFSLGQSVEGKSEPPAPEFGRAAELYGQAKDDSDVQETLDRLLVACEKEPRSAKTYNLIGACYRHLGKPTLALPFLWQSLTLEPEYDYALTNLGLCCQNLGLMKSARFYFEQEAVKNSTSSWVQGAYAKFQETNR